MLVHRSSIKLTVALALTSVTLFATSARGQSTTTRPGNSDKETVAAQGPRSGNNENKVAVEAPKPSDLESDVAAVKAERPRGA